ncbi:unnamed protein product [Chrysoparadoxa australica]
MLLLSVLVLCLVAEICLGWSVTSTASRSAAHDSVQKKYLDLKPGDSLKGPIVERHLGTKGLKVWIECGVWRYSARAKRMVPVNAQVRLTGREGKAMAKRKKLQAYVSKVDIGSGRLEASLRPPKEKNSNATAQQMPLSEMKLMSTLKPGMELRGTIVQVRFRLTISICYAFAPNYFTSLNLQ